VPVSERAGREFGCFITAREELGALPAQPPLYWHFDTFPTVRMRVRRRARGPSLNPWAASGCLRSPAPNTGRRAARVSTASARFRSYPRRFAAVYMEGVFKPGMSTEIHRHPGMEAWYTLEGSMCLETPSGRLDQRAGDPGVLVPDGVPMMLTGTGPRRSVVLTLQDATLPRSTPAHDWTPRGLCRQSGA
jgi:quercetin dioxygenase-like cupin family protein